MKTDNKLTRMLRMLSMPKEKVARLYRRYEQFKYYKLVTYGPGEHSPYAYAEMRNMQLQINAENEKSRAREQAI